MPSTLRVYTVLCAALSAALPTIAASPPPLGFDPQTMLRVSQVQPGDIAVGKTVFKGTRVEEFHLEILGIEKHAVMGEDLILARVTDGPLLARHAGILSGMSGSPVYVHGKLIGAVAYAWQFQREPIAGITPIEAMLDSWEPAAITHRLQPVTVTLPARAATPARAVTLRPAGLVAMAAGFSPRAVRQLNDMFEPYGIRVVVGPGSGRTHADFTLQPGAAVGLRYARGDLDLTAVGTLTYSKGERFLAFGHAVLGVGATEMPLVSAYIVDMMPSYADSFKLSASLDDIGVITADRHWAIAGILGRTARTVPLTMRVHDASGTKSYRVDIIRQRELLPGVAAIAALTLMDQTTGYAGEGSLRVTLTVSPEGRRPLQRTDLVHARFDMALEGVFLAVAQPLSLLLNNDFERVPVEGIDIEVEVLPERRSAIIRRAQVTQEQIHPGDVVSVQVVIEPFGKPSVQRALRLALPPDMPPGAVRVVVSNGADADAAATQIGVPRAQVTNLDQLLAQYERRGSPQELVLQAALTLSGAELQGIRLPMLPPSVLSALRLGADSGIRARRDMVKVIEPTDWALTGRATLTLRVTPPPGVKVPRPTRPPRPEPEETAVWPAPAEGWTLASPSTGDMARSARAAPPGRNQRPKPGEDGDKPLIRQPKSWTHSMPADFVKGRFENLAILPEGGLTLQPPVTPVASIPDPSPWAVAVGGPDNADVFVGGGLTGVVYRAQIGDGSQPAVPYFDTREVSVVAVALDAAGTLYAGTAPNGRIYRITGEDEGALLADLEVTYIWDLLPRSDGSLLAATGPGGVVYEVSADGRVAEYYETQATHVFRLAAGIGDEVYAGTAFDGVVHRISGRHQGSAVFSSSDLSVSALAVAGDRVFVGTAPGGRVYEVDVSGVARQWYAVGGSASVYALVPNTDGSVAIGIGPKGAIVTATATGAAVRWKPEAGQVLGLVAGGDRLVAVVTGPSRIVVLSERYTGTTRLGRYESEVLDASVTAQWGWISWMAQIPVGAQVYVQTRSGDAPRFGAGWSDWSPPYRVSRGQRISSPPARFLQYRVTAIASEDGEAPAIQQVRVTYLRPNTPPGVRITQPPAGAYWSGKQTIKWSTRDADGDTVTVSVRYSADQGRTWTTLAESVSGASSEWDTTTMGDGNYLLRVTASDELSNAADARTRDAQIVLVVDNKPPSLLVFRGAMEVLAEGVVRLRGRASDTGSGVAGVNYRIGDGPWRAALLDPGDLSGAVVPFEFITAPLAPGTHTVTLRAYDLAGNWHEEEVSVTVNEAADQPAEGGGAKNGG